MSFHDRNVTLSLGGEAIQGVSVSCVSINKEMKCDNVDFHPIPGKTITFTGWIVRPKY